MVQVTSDIQQRIITAAEQLHAENPERLPTVAEVRSASRANMNDVSIVMKQWRQNKIMPVQKIEEQAPQGIQNEALALASAIWGTAKEEAETKLREAEARFTEERAEAESLRAELSDACDSLQKSVDDSTAELAQAQQAKIDAENALESAQAMIQQLQQKLAQAQQSEALATAKAEQAQAHANDLKELLTKFADEKATK